MEDSKIQSLHIRLWVGKVLIKAFLFDWRLFPKFTPQRSTQEERIPIHPTVRYLQPRKVKTFYNLDWLCFEVCDLFSWTHITEVGIIYPENYDYKNEDTELVDRRYKHLCEMGWFS
jgi:hypothetical protein